VLRQNCLYLCDHTLITAILVKFNESPLHPNCSLHSPPQVILQPALFSHRILHVTFFNCVQNHFCNYVQVSGFMFIIVHHELGLNRPVLKSNSLFKGLPSHLHLFGLHLSINVSILSYILFTCNSQFDLCLIFIRVLNVKQGC